MTTNQADVIIKLLTSIDGSLNTLVVQAVMALIIMGLYPIFFK